MPKVSLESARAREHEILDKLSRVQKAAESHKQKTKLAQQRNHWIEQARLLIQEAGKSEDDLKDAVSDLAMWSETKELVQADTSSPDMWFQVSGLRQLVGQLRQRDPHRLREVPQQALQLQEVLSSMVLAVSYENQQLSSQVSMLEEECSSLRSKLRCELDELKDRPTVLEDRCDLSDEEDDLLENIGDGEQEYRLEMERLNVQVGVSLTELEQELSELRRRRAGWDDDAHFRFLHIKKEFQGRGRDLLVERLRLEFPHLTRDQVQQHEVTCDGLKYACQKQAATFRQWRRDRLNLLRKHQQSLQERQRAWEAQQKRLQDMQEVKDKGKILQGRLQVERQRALAKQEERDTEIHEEKRLQRAIQAEKEHKQRRRAAAVRQLSQNFAEQRQEQHQREKEDALQRERREAEGRAARMARNAYVVEMRRQLDALKRKEVAQQRAALEQERLERHMALQRAMENLRVEAPRDPSRLHKVPERLNSESYIDPLVCVTRGPAAGFDENRLMADARYKLSAALQAAGLYSTKAGQEALARVVAPKPAQPHMVSQVFSGNLGGYPSA